MALDSIEAALNQQKNEPDRRHFISHNQLIAPENLQRYAKMNVSANYTPFWFSDAKSTNIDVVPLAENNNKTLASTGARVVYGSDWPVSTVRPLDGIECVVTRRPMGTDPEQISTPYEDQCMTVQDAIKGYTIDGAYVTGVEKITGSLEVGKRTDMVILDLNILNCKANEIHKAKVVKTIIDGKLCFELK